MDNSIEQNKELINFNDVDIINEGNLILSNINLSIYKGEFIYIIGKVGSGKTSIINTLIGELPLRKGEASIGEFNLKKLKKRQIPYLRRKIGVIFQDFQLLMDRNVYENLLFVLKATGWKDSKSINNKINEVLSYVDMNLKSHKMPHQLSGGEQQRIAIARALLNDPEIILADEPTGNLDNDTANEIMDLLIYINRIKKTAILMITHNKGLLKDFPARTLLCEDMMCKEVVNSLENGIDFAELIGQ